MTTTPSSAVVLLLLMVTGWQGNNDFCLGRERRMAWLTGWILRAPDNWRLHGGRTVEDLAALRFSDLKKSRGEGPAERPDPSLFGGGPGMGDDLEVKVLPEPGRRDRREAQGVRREAYAERSVKRTRESTNRNRIRGAADRGERTTDREAPATKGEAA